MPEYFGAWQWLDTRRVGDSKLEPDIIAETSPQRKSTPIAKSSQSAR